MLKWFGYSGDNFKINFTELFSTVENARFNNPRSKSFEKDSMQKDVEYLDLLK